MTILVPPNDWEGNTGRVTGQSCITSSGHDKLARILNKKSRWWWFCNKRKFSSLWILTQKCFEVAYLWYNKQKYAVVIITSLSPGGRKGRGGMGWLQDFGSVMIKLTWSPPPSSLAVNRPSLFYNSPLILIWRRLTLPHPGCSPLKPWDTRSPRPPKMTGS